MTPRFFNYEALIEFDACKETFFGAVNNGYRTDEVKELKDHGIDGDSIFLGHLLGLYKALRDMGLVK